MFWESLNKLCKERNVKPTPLILKLGFSSSMVTKWKNGVMPGSEALIKIADYFNVSIDSLLGRKTPEEPKNDLTSSESDMLSLFRQLPEKEQLKELGRLELLVDSNTDAVTLRIAAKSGKDYNVAGDEPEDIIVR